MRGEIYKTTPFALPPRPQKPLEAEIAVSAYNINVLGNFLPYHEDIQPYIRQ